MSLCCSKGATVHSISQPRSMVGCSSPDTHVRVSPRKPLRVLAMSQVQFLFSPHGVSTKQGLLFSAFSGRTASLRRWFQDAAACLLSQACVPAVCHPRARLDYSCCCLITVSFVLLFLFFLVTMSYPTLHDPRSCSLPVSSVHGISQARILKWVAVSFSRGLPDPGI